MKTSLPPTITPTKKPLMLAAQDVARIEALLEAHEDDTTLPEEICTLMRVSVAELIDGVDRRKALRRSLSARVDLAKAYQADLAKWRKSLERTIDHLDVTTSRIVEQNPDVTFTDSTGTRLRLQRNSRGKVVLDFDLRKTKSIPNLVDDAAIEMLGIDDRYLETVTARRINMDRVRADLEAGRDVPFARIVHDSHLRGLK